MKTHPVLCHTQAMQLSALVPRCSRLWHPTFPFSCHRNKLATVAKEIRWQSDTAHPSCILRCKVKRNKASQWDFPRSPAFPLFSTARYSTTTFVSKHLRKRLKQHRFCHTRQRSMELNSCLTLKLKLHHTWNINSMSKSQGMRKIN